MDRKLNGGFGCLQGYSVELWIRLKSVRLVEQVVSFRWRSDSLGAGVKNDGCMRTT
jgi:hypothetical protein